MSHDDFKNRQVSIIDKGTHIEFVEHQFDEVRFLEKVEDKVRLSILVEGKNFFIKRGEENLEEFIFDHVIEPKFDTQEQLTDFLFISVGDSEQIKLALEATQGFILSQLALRKFC